jgi:hypothetical protein
MDSPIYAKVKLYRAHLWNQKFKCLYFKEDLQATLGEGEWYNCFKIEERGLPMSNEFQRTSKFGFTCEFVYVMME